MNKQLIAYGQAGKYEGDVFVPSEDPIPTASQWSKPELAVAFWKQVHGDNFIPFDNGRESRNGDSAVRLWFRWE